MWREIVATFKGFMGAIGWFGRMLLYIVAAALVIKVTMSQLGSVTDRYLAASESGYNRRVANALHSDIAAAAQRDEEVATLRRDNLRLTGIVAARVATCEQVQQREAQTGGQGVAATREALAACQIQLRTLTDTRLTREDCQRQAQDACNAAIGSTCPQAGQNVRIQQQAQ